MPVAQPMRLNTTRTVTRNGTRMTHDRSINKSNDVVNGTNLRVGPARHGEVVRHLGRASA
jgi:hypothetical protein